MADKILSDLELAYKTLQEKQAPYQRLWDFYDGKHPMVYSHDRLAEIFDNKYVNFSENWCAVVVDSVLDRVTLEGFTVSNDEAATAQLAVIVTDNELLLEADDVHKAALVIGEAFVIVSKEPDGTIDAYYNKPSLCEMFYYDGNPRKPRYAAKWWTGGGVTFITLYYETHTEYYAKEGDGSQGTAKDLKPYKPPFAVQLIDINGGQWPANAYGMIPVFHFQPDRRKVISILNNVLSPNTASNKLFSDMMIAAEYAALPQRYVISNGDIGALKNSPDEIWDVPAGDGKGQQTSVGAFAAAELANYDGARERLAQNISRITKLPLHYFSSVGGGVPSGEALIVMEAPLVKNTTRFIAKMSVTWGKLAVFLLLLGGTENAKRTDIKFKYGDVMTVQPKTAADTRLVNVNAGQPLTTVLRRDGWTQEELDEMENDRIAEQAQQANLATAYLAAAERNAAATGISSAAIVATGDEVETDLEIAVEVPTSATGGEVSA